MHISGLIFLLPFLLSGLPLALAKWKDDVSHRGKHFVITFAQVFYDNNFQPLVLVSTDQEGATVKIWMPRLSFERLLTIPAFSSTEVPLPKESRSIDNGIGNNAVLIQAETEVTVVGINRVEAFNDAFLALPTPALGLDYYAVTWDFLPFINVAAVFNDTTLTVTFPNNAKFKPFNHLGRTYAPGATLRVMLGAYQTYQIFSKELFSSEDLTGTRVEADKPIAVYSGSLTSKVLGKVPLEYHHLNDHLEEQLFPVNLWGQEFIMVHAPQRAVSSVLRVVTSQDKTTVKLRGKDSFELKKAGDFIDVDTDRDRNSYEVEASKPVQILVFEKSKVVGENGNSDPSMSTLIPNAYFSRNLTLRPLDETTVQRFEVFILIIARSIDIGTLRLNGIPLGNQNWTAVQQSPFRVREFKLAQKTYYLDSSSPNATFMAYVYGFRLDESYAFPTGFIAPYNKICQNRRKGNWPGVDNDCDGIPDRLPSVKCKDWTCAQHAGCIKDQCECQAPWYGAGRFACGKRDEECVCSAFGDPHTVDFNGARLEMPLQCRHLLAQVDLPDCLVRVYVEGREYGKNPLVSMLDKMEWDYGHPLDRKRIRGEATTKGISFIPGTKVPFDTRVPSNSTDVVFRVDEDFFYSIDSKCDVEIRYRAPVVTVRRPVPLAQKGNITWGQGRGLCGECTSNMIHPEPLSPLLRGLLSIDQVDKKPIRSQPSPLALVCSRIEMAIQTCNRATREEAVRQCSRLLDPSGPVSTCKVQIQTKDLYSAIALCVQRVCNKDPSFKDAFDVLKSC